MNYQEMRIALVTLTPSIVSARGTAYYRKCHAHVRLERHPRSWSRTNVRCHITRCQQRWLEHLRACEAQGCSLKHYALEHGLSAQAAYVAKSALKRRGAWPVSPPSISLTLVPVTVSRPPRADATVVRISLPNGAVIVTCGGALRSRAVVSARCDYRAT